MKRWCFINGPNDNKLWVTGIFGNRQRPQVLFGLITKPA